MNPDLKLAPRSFAARVADLGFTVSLPADWVAHELPVDAADFSDPTKLLPLALVTAPHAAIIFAVAARPAYDDGTLHDWAWYLLKHHGLKPRAVATGRIGMLPAIVGEAVQESEMGPMIVRFAFIEDGGRLLNLSFSAPEMLAGAVFTVWEAVRESFALASPRGSGIPLEPVVSPAPAPEPVRPFVELAPERSAAPPASNSEAPPSFTTFALADNDASLDPEHPINANLRDRGVGLVPNVVAADDLEKFAIVAAGAILAQFRVPFGWHVIDDGKRALVFEPTGRVQIHLNLIPREGRDNDAILDDLEAQMRSDYPNPEFMRVKEGNIHALGARHIADGDQALEQYHLLWPGRYDDLVLRARVTATPDRAVAANNLAELILNSMDLECFPHREEPKSASVTDGRPEWWRQAVALESENKLQEAEQLLKDSIPHIGFAASTAELYRQRMLRLKDAGDHAGAKRAFQEAHDWIGNYAGLATSGGEGAALSLERDQFRARLATEFGGNPEAAQA